MIAEKLISLVVMAVLAQHYAREELGAYLLVLSVTNLIAVVADLGTNRHLLRVCSAEPNEAGRHLGDVLSLRLPALFAALGVASLGVYAWQPLLLPVMLNVALFVYGREIYYAFGAVMLALGNVRGRVISGLTGPVILLAGIHIGIRSGLGFDQVMSAHIVAGLAMCVLGWLVARPQFVKLNLRINGSVLLTLARLALPLFLLGLLDQAFARSGEILLGWFKDLQTVADYGVGFRIVEACRLIIRPVAMVVFPLLVAAAAGGNWNSYRRLLRLLAGASVIAGLAVGVALFAASPWLMTGIFGDQYSGSVPLLRIFGFATPLVFILTAELILLVSLHLERAGSVIMLLGLSAYVVAGMLTIPRFGAYAAAWNSVFVHGALCFAMAVLITKSLRHNMLDADESKRNSVPVQT